MSAPYLVYLNDDGTPVTPHSEPIRILYVLSEHDLAEAFYSLDDDDYEVGDKDPDESDYWNLDADVRERMFDLAQTYIENLLGSNDWSGALTDAIQEVQGDS
jgi:hypothetical protein